MRLLLLLLFIASLIISMAGEYLCLAGCKKSFKSAQSLSIHERTCKSLQQQTQAASDRAYDQPIRSPWSRPSAPSVSSPKNPPEPGQRPKDARKRTNDQGGNERKRQRVAQEDRAGSSGASLNLVRSSCITLRPVAQFYPYPVYTTRRTGCLMLCHLTMLIYRVVSPNLLILSSLVAFGLNSNTERQVVSSLLRHALDGCGLPQQRSLDHASKSTITLILRFFLPLPVISNLFQITMHLPRLLVNT